ncbi:hypothetical protein JCGZ_15116 [Jatropha curcas]|uniref:Uncharacterized protein n=1 Tax=Jatropha curcas TaxID=180498 RepID=A0A067L9Y6_JATCU|nr:hypothetical protein JCGZ_15116 [Jatropha curcas]
MDKEDAPIKEVADDQVEKSQQEIHVNEEKPCEEPEIVVHEGDAEEEEEGEDEKEDEETANKENREEKFAGSPILGDDEPTASFDVEREAEADDEEGDLV